LSVVFSNLWASFLRKRGFLLTFQIETLFVKKLFE
jgi:hypothetical protein